MWHDFEGGAYWDELAEIYMWQYFEGGGILRKYMVFIVECGTCMWSQKPPETVLDSKLS